MNKNIGLLNFWGWNRGLSYLALCHVKMLQDKYDVYILKQGTNPINEEFKSVKAQITEYPNYIVDKEFFKNWIITNKLDAIIYYEYKQWNSDSNELVKLARSLGVKTYGHLAMERFDVSQTYDYDRILAPTISFERFMRVNKCRNFTYVPFSIDLNEFPITKREENKQFIFLHPGGWGGVGNRKNTEVVIKAFELLNRDDTQLIVTSQKQLNLRNLPKNVEIIDRDLTRQEMIDLYYKADATLLPNKWDTINIPILESLAAGTPVITSNVPPMNEFVRDCLNGYLCNPEMVNVPNISVYAAIIDPMELKKKMEIMLNKTTYEIIQKNSRRIVETLYDLNNNKNYLLSFLEMDLK